MGMWSWTQDSKCPGKVGSEPRSSPIADTQQPPALEHCGPLFNYMHFHYDVFL